MQIFTNSTQLYKIFCNVYKYVPTSSQHDDDFFYMMMIGVTMSVLFIRNT